MTVITTTTGEMITPPTEMTYQDRLIIKDTCDKMIRCMWMMNKYSMKELRNRDYLDDYEEYDDYKKATTIPIYSYRNENNLDGYFRFFPTRRVEDYRGNIGTTLILSNSTTEESEYDTSMTLPVYRWTKGDYICNAVLLCDWFYAHFCKEHQNDDGTMRRFGTLGTVGKMLDEEYEKKPLFR